MTGMAELEIMATGVAIVMGVLSLLWAMTAMIGGVVKLGGRVKSRPGKTVEAPTDQGGIPSRHLVAIVAAVAEVIDEPHHIVKVSAPAHTAPSWAGHGRTSRHLADWRGLRPSNGGR
ncbi:MAG: hypothetical protein HN403_08685 [Rhodospirillales bacterium]|jgi:Na+-transporting methylmalonyl-CoA/oxaloacetate decarboxylase gamma subunit|nr:hypothetical protein [Rhodospirillales bacterium]